jgi:hypothetical protein
LANQPSDGFGRSPIFLVGIDHLLRPACHRATGRASNSPEATLPSFHSVTVTVTTIDNLHLSHWTGYSPAGGIEAATIAPGGLWTTGT